MEFEMHDSVANLFHRYTNENNNKKKSDQV